MKHTDQEFAILLEALSRDVVDAHIHWRLALDLATALKDHPKVEVRSRVFWSLTRRAHISVALQCLARAFDQEKSSLHLLGWLEVIRDNQKLFSATHYRGKQDANRLVANFADSDQKPNPETLESDIKLCSRHDSDVKRLIQYRGSRSAHRGKSLTLDPKPPGAAPQLTDQTVEVLLGRAKTILNRYSHKFSAAIFLAHVVDHDDYKIIFTSVENAIHARSSQ